MLLMILGFLLFVGLVVVHEYGHFIVAKRNGVEVEEFGIGFPPRAKTLTIKDGTRYTLNWLPLGGFVKLKGENDADRRKGTFGAAPLSVKIKIMLAGVVMNTLTAFLLFTLLAFVGMPKLFDNQFTVAGDARVVQRDVLVAQVAEDSPAQSIGIQAQDKLHTISNASVSSDADSTVVENSESLADITKSYAGEQVLVQVVRDGNNLALGPVQLRTVEEVEASKGTDKPLGHLGVVPTEYVVERSTWSSPIVAAGFMKQITVETFKGLGMAVSGLARGDTQTASSQVSGIIGIGYILSEGSALGLQFILLIVAIISLTLAIMNVLPIPALDGGRLFVTLLYRMLDFVAKFFDKRVILTPKVEEVIHGTGFIALMILFVLISIVDVQRFW